MFDVGVYPIHIHFSIQGKFLHKNLYKSVNQHLQPPKTTFDESIWVRCVLATGIQVEMEQRTKIWLEMKYEENYSRLYKSTGLDSMD